MQQAFKFLLQNINLFGVAQVAETLRRFKVSFDDSMVMIAHALRGEIVVLV
jgi:hypothetical protein